MGCEPEPEPLIGTVTIQGEAVAGNTLTANMSNSNYTGILSYQWKANGIDISDAVLNYYKLTDNEVGKTITVTVSSSIESGSITSLPTLAVESAAILPPLPTSIKMSDTNLSLKKGTAIITVKTSNGKTAECKITVGEVKLNVNAAKMQLKQTTKAFVIKSKYPQNDTVAKWTSSNSSVASVNKKGKVKAKKTCTTILTVTMKSKATASIRLKVVKSVIKTKKLSTKNTRLTLNKGQKHTLKITRKPVTANDKLTFTSSAPKIATVSKSGVVKGLSKGTVKITVKSASRKKYPLGLPSNRNLFKAPPFIYKYDMGVLFFYYLPTQNK